MGSFPQQETLRLRGFPQLAYLLGDGGSVLVTPAGCRNDAAREADEGKLVQFPDFEGIGLGVRPQPPRKAGDLVGSLSERSFAGNSDQRGYTAEHRVGNPPVGGEVIPWQSGLLIQPAAGEKPPCDTFPFLLQRAFHARISLLADSLIYLREFLAELIIIRRTETRRSQPADQAAHPIRSIVIQVQPCVKSGIVSGFELVTRGLRRAGRPQFAVPAPPVTDVYLAAVSELADLADGIEKADRPPEQLGNVIRRKCLQILWIISHR